MVTPGARVLAHSCLLCGNMVPYGGELGNMWCALIEGLIIIDMEHKLNI